MKTKRTLLIQVTMALFSIACVFTGCVSNSSVALRYHQMRMNRHESKIHDQDMHPMKRHAHATFRHYHQQRLVELRNWVEKKYTISAPLDHDQQCDILMGLSKLSARVPHYASLFQTTPMILQIHVSAKNMPELERYINDNIIAKYEQPVNSQPSPAGDVLKAAPED